MNITEEVTFDNTGRVERNDLFKKLFLSLVIILVASLSFGIGRLTRARGEQGIKIEFDASLTSPTSQTAAVTNSLTSLSASSVIASKSGSKYHYPHCAGAKQIKEANKLTFPNAVAAEAAGYTLAANCSPK